MFVILHMRGISKISLKKPKKPEVVLCTTDETGKGFLKHLAETASGCSESVTLAGRSLSNACAGGGRPPPGTGQEPGELAGNQARSNL